jgi:DNA-binding response OmpR family regulator
MSLSRARILVVDDEAAVHEMLREYFASRGYTVDAVSSGKDALAAIQRARPDLVLLDVHMPGIDGVEVLRRIRELDDALVVIMVTADRDVAQAREALKLGAFDYVAKPFDYAYLDLAVSAGLRQPSVASAAEKPLEADPWRRLAHAVFRVARAMEPAARASTGARMEAAALAAAREVAAGRAAVAGQHLEEVGLLLSIAGALGDLPGPDRTLVETTLDAALRSLPVAP